MKTHIVVQKTAFPDYPCIASVEVEDYHKSALYIVIFYSSALVRHFANFWQNEEQRLGVIILKAHASSIKKGFKNVFISSNENCRQITVQYQYGPNRVPTTLPCLEASGELKVADLTLASDWRMQFLTMIKPHSSWLCHQAGWGVSEHFLETDNISFVDRRLSSYSLLTAPQHRALLLTAFDCSRFYEAGYSETEIRIIQSGIEDAFCRTQAIPHVLVAARHGMNTQVYYFSGLSPSCQNYLVFEFNGFTDTVIVRCVLGPQQLDSNLILSLRDKKDALSSWRSIPSYRGHIELKKYVGKGIIDAFHDERSDLLTCEFVESHRFREQTQAFVLKNEDFLENLFDSALLNKEQEHEAMEVSSFSPTI